MKLSDSALHCAHVAVDPPAATAARPHRDVLRWGWGTLGHVFDAGWRPLWKAMEDAIRRLPPWAALLLFALPALLLFPVKVWR